MRNILGEKDHVSYLPDRQTAEHLLTFLFIRLLPSHQMCVYSCIHTVGVFSATACSGFPLEKKLAPDNVTRRFNVEMFGSNFI